MNKTEEKSAKQEGFDAFDLDGSAMFESWAACGNRAEWIGGFAEAGASEGWALGDLKELARKFAGGNAAEICKMFDEHAERLRSYWASRKSTEASKSAAKLGTWEVHPSARGTFMVIEEDGTEDGRLIADRMREADARHIADLHNAATGSAQ